MLKIVETVYYPKKYDTVYQKRYDSLFEVLKKPTHDNNLLKINAIYLKGG